MEDVNAESRGRVLFADDDRALRERAGGLRIDLGILAHEVWRRPPRLMNR